jgi:hypothetical protein
MFPPTVGQSVSGTPNLAETQPGRISLPLSADAVQRLAKVYRLILDRAAEVEARTALAGVEQVPATTQLSPAGGVRYAEDARQVPKPVAAP